MRTNLLTSCRRSPQHLQRERDLAESSGIERIEQELKSGGEVNITGFGKFKVNQRPAREGRNPQTGEKMRIEASKVPSFSADNALKKAVK